MNFPTVQLLEMLSAMLTVMQDHGGLQELVCHIGLLMMATTSNKRGNVNRMLV